MILCDSEMVLVELQTRSPPGTCWPMSSILTRAFSSRYNPDCALSQVQPLEPWGNTVYGYAT